MGTSIIKSISGRAFAGLRWALAGAGYRVERFDQASFFEPLLYQRLRRSPDFFFVQIGANDGVASDPIRRFVTRNRVAGLVVEPLADIFARLKANYRDFPKINPVQTALHRTARTMEMHRVDPSRGQHLGGWTQGIASFDARHHTLSQTPGEFMVTETVPCMTLEELFAQERVGHVDLLQIDTEGYDAEIIEMIDFDRRRPALIRFEHGLPDGVMSLSRFEACIHLLMAQGYFVITEPYDAIAYQPTMI